MGWIEPEAAAGIAWIEYMAWTRFKDPRFLDTADGHPRAGSPAGRTQSAVRSASSVRRTGGSPHELRAGPRYDVGKLLNECFDPHAAPQARPGWGVISDRWNGLDASGLVGSTTDGEGYAFAMNTFQWAGAMAPIARYDTRYAHDIGKWMFEFIECARAFLPRHL